MQLALKPWNKLLPSTTITALKTEVQSCLQIVSTSLKCEGVAEGGLNEQSSRMLWCGVAVGEQLCFTVDCLGCQVRALPVYDRHTTQCNNIISDVLPSFESDKHDAAIKHFSSGGPVCGNGARANVAWLRLGFAVSGSQCCAIRLGMWHARLQLLWPIFCAGHGLPAGRHS
eukprot:5391100-Amphidinium_carterae.1